VMISGVRREGERVSELEGHPESLLRAGKGGAGGELCIEVEIPKK